MPRSRAGIAGFGVLGLATWQFSEGTAADLAKYHQPANPTVKTAAAHYADLIAGGGKATTAWKTWGSAVDALKPFKPVPAARLVVFTSLSHVVMLVALLGLLAAARNTTAGWRTRLNSLWFDLRGQAILVGIGLGAAAHLSIAFAAVRPPHHLRGFPTHLLAIGSKVALGLGILLLVIERWSLVEATCHAVWRARPLERALLTLGIAFVALTSFGLIGVQFEDLVERWVQGRPGQALWALGAYLVFVFALLLAASLRIPDVHKPEEWSFAIGLGVAGLVISLAGLVVWHSSWTGHGADVAAVGIVLLAIAALDALAKVRPDDAVEPSAAIAPKVLQTGDAPDRFVLGATAAVPAVGVALILVRGLANTVAVGTQDLEGGSRASHGWWLVAAIAVAFAAAVGGWAVVAPSTLSTKLKGLGLNKVEGLAGVALGVVLLAAAVVAGFTEATATGGICVLLCGLLAVTALGIVVRSAARRAFGTPSGLRMLGFSRTPMIVLAVAWVLLASTLNARDNQQVEGRSDFNDARTLLVPGSLLQAPAPPKPSTPEGRCRTALQDRSLTQSSERVVEAFCHWVTHVTAPASGPIPLVLVTASGGGVRASAWTEQVLDCTMFRLDPASCSGNAHRADRWQYVFAANGASGGSVGIASATAERLAHPGGVDDATLGHRWIDDQLSSSPVEATISHAIFDDGLLGLTGVFRGRDRAAVLEDTWSARWRNKSMAGCDPSHRSLGSLGFRALAAQCPSSHVPLLLFNGTDTKTGRRVDIAPLDLSPPHDNDDSVRPFEVVDELAKGQGKAADQDQDLPLFTAAFLSARFPLVSPSGRLPSCHVGKQTQACPSGLEHKPVINVVDGGYLENSGSAQVAALRAQLVPLVSAYNSLIGPTDPLPDGKREQDVVRRPTEAKVRMVLLEIENGEAGADKPTRLGSSLSELLRPVQAVLAARHDDSGASIATLRASFLPCTAKPDDPLFPVRFHFVMYQHPGRSLPLGWTLAPSSIDAVRAQYGANANEQTAICFAQVVPQPGH